MLITNLCRAPVVRVLITKPFVPRNQVFRTYARGGRGDPYERGRSAFEQVAKRPTLKERLMAPAGPNAFGIGQGAVAGAAIVGLGALGFYGLGLSNQAGAVDKAMLWPPIVKQRIKDTYMYFGASIAVSAGSAFAVFTNPTLLRLVTRNGWMSLIGTMAAMIGTGALAQSIDYSPGFGAKQMAWLLHAAVMGGVLAPIAFMGGPILIRAGWYTAGIVGGLSTISVCAPSEKFLWMGAPLGMGLGAVFAASLANMWLPPTSVLGAGLYSFSLYGGLILFSGFLLYDTQRIVKVAETYPTYMARPYDPINSAMSIYMDTLNIFIRMVMILSNSGSKGRRN